MIRWILRWIIGHRSIAVRPLPTSGFNVASIAIQSCKSIKNNSISSSPNLRRDASRIGPETASRTKVDVAENSSRFDIVRSALSSETLWIGITMTVAASIVILFFYVDSASNKSELANETSPRELRNPMNEDEATQIREQLLAASQSLRDRIKTEYKSKKELLENRRLLEQFPSASQLVETPSPWAWRRPNRLQCFHRNESRTSPC